MCFPISLSLSLILTVRIMCVWVCVLVVETIKIGKRKSQLRLVALSSRTPILSQSLSPWLSSSSFLSPSRQELRELEV